MSCVKIFVNRYRGPWIVREMKSLLVSMHLGALVDVRVFQDDTNYPKSTAALLNSKIQIEEIQPTVCRLIGT